MTTIPAINKSALNAIADPQTRSVLRDLAQGWETRNHGQHKFLSESDVLGSTKLKNYIGEKIDAVRKEKAIISLSPGELSRVMADLHTQVIGGKLFRDLDYRIDLIDKPGGLFDNLNTLLAEEIEQRASEYVATTEKFAAMGVRIGEAETAITEETTQRVNAISAITQTITTQYAAVQESLALIEQSLTTAANAISALVEMTTTMEAVLGDHSAAISEEWQARVNLENDFYASYTLRVDVNGRVSGFGLAATGETSQFIVRADVFALVSPHGNNAVLTMQPNRMSIFDEAGNLRTLLGYLG